MGTIAGLLVLGAVGYYVFFWAPPVDAAAPRAVECEGVSDSATNTALVEIDAGTVRVHQGSFYVALFDIYQDGRAQLKATLEEGDGASMYLLNRENTETIEGSPVPSTMNDITFCKGFDASLHFTGIISPQLPPDRWGAYITCSGNEPCTVTYQVMVEQA